MYGCYDGAVVYGVCDESRAQMLDPDWLAEHYPAIQTYASDVIRNHLGNPVYGVICHLDRSTGRATLMDEEKEVVDRLAAAMKSKAMFQLAVYGDYVTSQHELYTL